MLRTLRNRTILGIAGLIAVLGFGSSDVLGADHLDSPRVRTNGRLDINDVYLFASPSNPNRIVIAVTLSPAAGLLSPVDFQPGAKYEILIDTDGDANEDSAIRFTFSAPNRNGAQRLKATLLRRGPELGLGHGLTNTTLVSAGNANNRIQIRAGLFDDPFFFDLEAFRRINQTFNPAEFGANPRNFFATFNTLAIVIELPAHLILPKGDRTLGVWARTIGNNGTQFERMAIPTVNTVLVKPDSQKDLFNSGRPRDDRANFGAISLNTLTSAPYSQSQARAQSLVNFLLPDILPLNLDQPSAFPNGRAPIDDVIDIELNLITNGGIKTDFIANDSNFRTSFPYLGVAQQP